MSYDRAARLKKSAHVRLDRFELFHLGRDEQLGALDRWLLACLAMLCDYKTGDYLGTITELAEDSGATRRAVAGALDRLDRAGIVQIVAAFGPKMQGQLRLLVLDRLVVDVEPVNRAVPRERPEPHLKKRERPNRAPIARQSRANRADTAPNDANTGAVTCDDAGPLREQGRRVEGETVSREDVAVALLEKELGAQVISFRERAS